MADSAKPIPEGFHTVTPHLVVRGAADAIVFYKKAFGAEELMRLTGPDESCVMHAEIKIGDSPVFLCDEFPGMEGWVAPTSLKGTTVTLSLYVEDVDAFVQRAVDAGATLSMPVMDTFWGDRYGKVTDPFGHEWGIATHKRDLTPEEIQKGAEQFFKDMGECKPE
jgi:uncharacterized glyoxalase superfamily protein PhnB